MQTTSAAEARSTLVHSRRSVRDFWPTAIPQPLQPGSERRRGLPFKEMLST